MSRPLALASLAILAALSAAPSPTRANDDASQPSRTLYALAQDGRMTINGTTSKTYASDFDIDVDVDDDFLIIILPGGIYIDGGIEVDIDNPDDLWSSIAAEGSTRYALRRDGVMKKNDKSFVTLPLGNGTVWLDMVAATGKAWSVRSDGRVMSDGKEIADYQTEGFAFRRILYDRGDVYVLRSDGSVFRNGASTPLFEFRAGDGDLGFGDGLTVETTWIAMAVDPTAEFLYALRCDGNVFRGRLDSDGDESRVVALPYDRFARPYVGQLFIDIDFRSNGTWYALACDGRVYTHASGGTPLVDLPGNASQSGRVFVDVATLDDDWFALRSDGRVYANGDDVEIVDLAGEAYGSLALSDEPAPPVEDGSKKPKATLINTKTVVGTPIFLPVVATDADTCTPDLEITPQEPLPPGSVWDAERRALIWDSPGPAETYKLDFKVSDGINTVDARYKLKVKDPDTDASKNKEPLIPAFEKGQAIVGFEYVLTVIVDDADGDAVTVAVDPEKKPFSLGATFDPETRVFRWTPSAEDVGDVTAKFQVTDGKAKKTVKLTLKVKNGL